MQRMTRVALGFGAAVILVTGAAWADGMKVEPGRWEFETTTKQPFAPQPMTRTSTECIAEAEIDPSTFAKEARSCTISDIQTDGDSMKWKIVCSEGGGTMTGTGSAISTGASVTGSMNMVMQMAGQTMEIKSEWKGKRVGECE